MDGAVGEIYRLSPVGTSSSSSSWHTPKIATEDIAIAKSSVAKSSGFHHHHHHHVGDYDYIEDIDEDGFDSDDPVDDHDDPGVTLVSEDGNMFTNFLAIQRFIVLLKLHLHLSCHIIH